MIDNQARIEYLKKFENRPKIYQGMVGTGRTARKLYATSGDQLLSPDTELAKLFIQCYLEIVEREEREALEAQQALTLI